MSPESNHNLAPLVLAPAERPRFLCKIRGDLKPLLDKLEDEAQAGNGHGFFWLLYLDRLNRAEHESIKEVDGSDLKDAQDLKRSIVENACSFVDDIKMRILETEHDARFKVDLSTGAWGSPQVTGYYGALAGMQEDEILSEVPFLYDIVYKLARPSRF